MTDPGQTSIPQRIDIAVADTMQDAVNAVVVERPALAPVILPSSGRRQDEAVAAVRHRLRTLGVNSTILLPGGITSLAPFTRSEGGAWHSATIDVAGQPVLNVSLPALLLSSGNVWLVTDVDVVAGRGPHVLDLAARYLRRTDRIRGLRSGDRSWVVAVNSLLSITGIISTVWIDDIAVAIGTSDLIAGELAALAMAELRAPHRGSVTGVWEDSLVQRATELHLGALYPGQLHPNVHIATANARASTIVEEILTTMGVAPT